MSKKLLALFAILLAVLPAASAAVTTAASPNAAAAPNAVTRYYTIPGIAFIPASDIASVGTTTSWYSPGLGCLGTWTDVPFHAALNLPDGTAVTSVTFGYKNQSVLGAGMTASLDEITDFTPPTSITLISDTASGAHTVTQPTNLTIDNSTHSYAFNWAPNLTGIQYLCFIRLTYIPAPTFAAALPIIRN